MKSKQRITLLTANLLHIFGLSILAPVYALYGVTLGATAWQVGLSWGLYNIIAGLTNIFTGRLIDGNKRDRLFIIVGYIITIIGTALFLLAWSPSQLYLIMVVNAIGVGLYMPAWKVLYTRAENKNKVATEWGIFDGTNMIAMAGAAVLAGYLVNSNRYTIMFGVIIAFYTAATLFAFRLKHES